jgi:EAL domain-containing protein (putative c-di-GMP-specific phosphodiesterase class I)/ActR/RegA family two-component response regulator
MTNRLRVLLVDDEESIRAVFASMLEEVGLEVVTASNAHEALDLMRAHKWDVIVSDIKMPEISGIELLRKIREIDLDVPVVLMTGGPTIDSAIEAMEYGAFRYLRKPMSASDLQDAVTRAGRYHVLARLKRDALGMLGAAAQWPSDRAAVERRFESALGQLWMAFQPIVLCRERQVHAFEALLRSDEPSFARPLDLIEAAERLERLVDLGRAVRAAVAAAVPRVPAAALLFVNLHPTDLNDPHLLSDRNPLLDVSQRVVFEVTERVSLRRVDALPRRLERLRSMGFKLAIDDLGAGYAGLTSMAQVEPEYVKLDMSLIRDMHERPTQRALVRSMVSVCHELGQKVIAEGIEIDSEREALLEAGCELQQGYFFARPGREIPTVSWDA